MLRPTPSTRSACEGCTPDEVRKALQEAELSEFLEGHSGLANRVSGSQTRPGYLAADPA